MKPTPEERLQEAIQHHRAGRLAEAAAHYRSILAESPDHPDALHLLGVVRAQEGAPAEAAALIEQATHHHPDQPDIWSNLSKAYERAGRLDRAADACAQAVRLRSDDDALLVRLAHLQERCGHLKAAGDAYHRLSVRGSLTILDRVRYAHLLYITRRFDAAASQYQILATANPNDATWPLSLGNCHYNRKAYAAAIEQYRIAATLQPTDARAFFNLGRTLELLARPDDAEQAYRKAVAADSNHIGAWNGLLMLLVSCGRHDEAKACGHAALEAKDRQADNEIRTRGNQPTTFAPLQPGPLPAFAADRPGRNVICYSLWGNGPLYTEGAVANTHLVARLFPGWTCRIYHDATVPAERLRSLRAAGAQLVAMPPRRTAHEGLFWRFYAANDPAVDRFLCRDADCRLSPREAEAVEAWLASDKPFHIMRDHLFHAEPILAGLWGGVAGLLPDLRTATASWVAAKLGNRWQDQDFLCRSIWPLIRTHSLIHDRVYRFGPGARDFPSPLSGPDAMRIGDRVAVTRPTSD